MRAPDTAPPPTKADIRKERLKQLADKSAQLAEASRQAAYLHQHAAMLTEALRRLHDPSLDNLKLDAGINHISSTGKVAFNLDLPWDVVKQLWDKIVGVVDDYLSEQLHKTEADFEKLLGSPE